MKLWISRTVARSIEKLSSDGLLKNIGWNAAGTVLPILAAVVSIPTLVETLGVERFGILSLAWVVVGYFSFFDMGLGRAMTQVISQRIGVGAMDEFPSIAQTGLALMIVLGAIGGTIVASISPWLVNDQLAIPELLIEETLISFLILAASIPVVILSTGLRGILEAHQRFDAVNIIRAPVGALTYIGPLVVLNFTHELPPVVAALAAARFVSLLAFSLICVRFYPELVKRTTIRKHLIVELLSFGGWMTLSNIAGPMLLYAGRVALIVFVSADAVAYFSTPYDVVISVLLIPGIFIGVLFPIFSKRFSGERMVVRSIYRQSLWQNLFVVFPISAFIFVFAKPAISVWINPEFAEQSYRVAQYLAVGVFINSFGYYSQALVQAAGRPDLTAKLHVAELFAYIPYMTWLVTHFGVEGAAVSWVIRVAISTAALTYLAEACLSGRLAPVRRK